MRDSVSDAESKAARRTRTEIPGGLLASETMRTVAQRSGDTRRSAESQTTLTTFATSAA